MLNRRLCTTSISYALFMQALRELPHLMKTLLHFYKRLKSHFSAKVLHFNLFFIIWGGGKKCKQNNKRAIFNHHEETFCQFTFKNAQIHNTEV